MSRELAGALVLTLLASNGIAQMQPAAATTIALSTGWQFRQESLGTQEQWLPAQVPGDVDLDLLRNKLIPKPFFRDNVARLQWIGDANWSYRTTINANPSLMRRPHLELVFEGLDTTATVYLNDKLILSANNMFRRWRINVKPYLHPGANELRVEFENSTQAAETLAASNPNQSEIHVPQKSYLRKAAYEHGWDFAPPFVTYGIWRPVYLEAWDKARIDDVYISEPDINSVAAHLVAKTTVMSSSDTSAKIELSYHLDPSGKTVDVTHTVMLHAGKNEIAIPVNIAHPALWFPAGYGAQHLYTFHIAVEVDGNLQDHKTVQTGLRSIVLRRKRDKWGRSFEFVVNGIPIFAKGASVVPFDSFPNRVTDAKLRRTLQSAKDANMNMIRVWGGGYYEPNKFYQLCDQLGLMVWQDFMFSDSWYPGGHNWKRNVRIEAEQQVARLRNHPSMTLWSGNNEVESVVDAFTGGDSAKAQVQIWKNYLTVFSGIIPAVVQHEDPEVPYWPSTPSSNYLSTSTSFQAGDAHDWSVWHGGKPFSAYREHFYRFTSEYGFQSFPDQRTVDAFTTPADQTSISTPVMLAHQRENGGNKIIQQYLLRYYPKPKNFTSFLYVSQVLQAEGIKVGAEHMRRNRPRIMGSLFWQLNDTWPGVTWSSIDYYGRWKALQYYARRFYSPLLISPTLRHGNVLVYGISDKLKPTQATLRIRVLTMYGRIVKEVKKTVTLPALSSGIYIRMPLQSIVAQANDLTKVFVTADMTVDDQQVSRNILYLEPTKDIKLISAKLTTHLAETGDAYTLRISSPVLARDVYVSFGDLNVHLSDNYFNILPGHTAKITIRSKQPLSTLLKQLKVISLTDAFAPGDFAPYIKQGSDNSATPDTTHTASSR
jgi:beta-mannosidase